MLGYAQLTAPFAGVVTAKTVEPGTLATPGAPLLTIEREGDYRLEAAGRGIARRLHPGRPCRPP